MEKTNVTKNFVKNNVKLPLDLFIGCLVCKSNEEKLFKLCCYNKNLNHISIVKCGLDLYTNRL